MCQSTFVKQRPDAPTYCAESYASSPRKKEAQPSPRAAFFEWSGTISLDASIDCADLKTALRKVNLERKREATEKWISIIRS